MVAKVHAGFVTALDGFEVVGTASTGAPGARGGRAAAARPGPARRVPARHDRAGGAAPAAGGRVAGRRHRHQRRPGRRQHPRARCTAASCTTWSSRSTGAPSRRGCTTTRGCAASSRSSTRPARATSTGCSAGLGGGPRRRRDPEGHRPGDPGTGAHGAWPGPGRRALGHRVQRAHRPGAGQRAALPGAVGGRSGGRRPAAVRHRRTARAPVHPAGSRDARNETIVSAAMQTLTAAIGDDARMTIVVGYVPTPEGEAALTAAITEAQRREEPLHIVNTARGDTLSDRRYASEDTLDVAARPAGPGRGRLRDQAVRARPRGVRGGRRGRRPAEGQPDRHRPPPADARPAS